MSDQSATANNQFGEATAANNTAANNSAEEAPANNVAANNVAANNVAANNVAANNGEAAANNGSNNAAGNNAAANNVAANNVAANNVAANNGEAAANNGAANNGEAAANNGAANNTVANNGAAANVEGEGELAAKLNQTPAVKKKGLSAAAQSVLDDRMKTFAELKAAYAAAFGDDKKAPKAKSYEAFALHKIRKEQGEEAFQAKIKEFVARNQGKFASGPVKKPSKKVKFNSAIPKNVTAKNVTAKNVTAKNVTAKNASSRTLVIESVRTMGSTAKGLIDSMIATVNALAKTNTGDMSAVAQQANAAANSAPKKSGTRKPRSNKGKTHKKRTANA